MQADGYNYLIFSDVHLGADLVQHVRPSTTSRLERLATVDQELGAMLDYYLHRGDPERPWKLIIAGDLVDFVGMSVAPLPGEKLETELNDEEQRNGLGSSCEHAKMKMRAVAKRHALIFQKFAAFVSAGHSIVLVRGNHDIEFHWEAARGAFVEAIAERMEDRASIDGRVEFAPWFYYVEGLLYVEHGHQYDELCSYPHILEPVRPKDPTRIVYSLSDLLLRLVARPTGIGIEGHDGKTALDYVKLGFSLGLRGMGHLAYCFFAAIWHALAQSRDHLTQRVHAIRLEHERKMEEFSASMRIKMDALKKLAAIAPESATSRPYVIIQTLMIDKVLLVFGTIGMFSLLAITAMPWPYWIVIGVLVALGFGFVFGWSARWRVIDPSEALRRSARSIAKLLPSRFIVMGHTHAPTVEPVDDKTYYINVGNWAVDDLVENTRVAPRTHLVIRYVDGVPKAEFCAWQSDGEPLRSAVG